MTRPVQQKSPEDLTLTMVMLISSSGVAGIYNDFNFKDGSIDYFGIKVKQAFKYTLIDNIGTGYIRICYNRPEYDLTKQVIGTKMLKSGDTLYIDENVWNIRIYYITPSSVELILKSDKSGDVL